MNVSFMIFIFLGTEYLISNPIDLGNATRTISHYEHGNLLYNCRI